MRKIDVPEGILPAHKDLFYAGGWHAPVAGEYQDTINPAYNEVLASAAVADAQDVDAAVKAAHEAFQTWRDVTPKERAALMRKAASVLREHKTELALLDALNNGNPVKALMPDADMSADALDFFAGLVTELKGETIPMGENNLNYSIRKPHGVVARIVAYNHPLMFAASRLAAPLAAGNTVIIKASHQTPLSVIRLGELIGNIFPPCVVSFLTGGLACGEALTDHPLVRKVTLIGSVGAGQGVMRNAASSLKPVVLELGGKNALIAYPDVDIDKMINGVIAGMNFTWSGQSCGSTSRVFLHESIHDQVVDGVAAKLSTLHKAGDPTDPETTMGALISEQHLNNVKGFVESALKEGARLVTGGKQSDNEEFKEGFFYEPTVFADVTPDMRIAREEIFGPVVSIMKWKDEDEVFAAANALEFGLTGSIWTNDLNTAHRAASRLETGFVWINNVSQHFLGAPFGGIKHSGIGREECLQELLDFTYTKNINIKLG